MCIFFIQSGPGRMLIEPGIKNPFSFEVSLSLPQSYSSLPTPRVGVAKVSLSQLG